MIGVLEKYFRYNEKNIYRKHIKYEIIEKISIV